VIGVAMTLVLGTAMRFAMYPTVPTAIVLLNETALFWFLTVQGL
jgi:hypothetical protein